MWFGHVEWMEGERQPIAALHGGKEKQRKAMEDLDGQCQGRPEEEKHRLDQDWRGNQKQRGGVLLEFHRQLADGGAKRRRDTAAKRDDLFHCLPAMNKTASLH